MLSKKYLRRKLGTGVCDHTLPPVPSENPLFPNAVLGDTCKKPGRRYYRGEKSSIDMWLCDEHAEIHEDRSPNGRLHT